MAKRISRMGQFMEICKIIAQRGTCQRAKVACVITRNNRIVSTGYNGPLNIHCESFCNTENKCTHAVHAEINAIAAAAKAGISLMDSTLYCTYSPCGNCANAVVQAGIRKVVYEKVYTTDGCLGLSILTNNGIKTHHYNPELDLHEPI